MSRSGIALGLLIVAGLAASVVKHLWNQSVIEDRTNGFVSASAAIAAQKGILVGEFVAEPTEIHCGDRVVRLRSAWLERRSDVAFTWVWFMRPKPTGENRIVIDWDSGTANPYEFSFWRIGTPNSFSNAGHIVSLVVPPSVVGGDFEVRNDSSKAKASFRLAITR